MGKKTLQAPWLLPSLLALLALADAAWGLPGGEQVTAGAGTIRQGGANLTVTQQSDRLSINWDSFSINAGEAVRFNQPGPGSIVLNRVLGQDPSTILGCLSANGQVFLLNPNGVLFGAGSQVDVGGLVASTLQLSDQALLTGRYNFAGHGTAGSVVNGGTIHAADGGYVALIAPRVSNAGTITAPAGTVALGAGNGVTLTFADHRLLSLAVDQGAVRALAENRQLIQADGGQVILSAQGRDAVLAGLVNNEGVIQARTVANRQGVITLLGGMEHDRVQVTGTLDAAAPNGGDGGFIETSAARVRIDPSATITTAAPQGKTGQWLLDPTDYSIAASGGDLTGAALASQLNTSNVTIQTESAGPGNGDILLNDAVAWNSANRLSLSAHHNVNINATVSNAGTGGVTLRADSQGACVPGAANCGTVLFGAGGGISVNGGAVRLDYNPAGANAASPSYATPTDYTAKVTLADGSTFTPRMLVNDVTQLQAMTSNLSGDYALGRDIDAAATSTWNAGAGFLPIGDTSVNFTGSLDGNSHVISDLYINRPASNNVGLFGVTQLNAGGLRNLGLHGGSITGSHCVGALAGQNKSGGPITNVYASSTVTGTSWQVGGLLGANTGSSITDSHSSGPVSGNFFVGGLAGSNQGVMTNSSATGSVNNTGSFTGGLVGFTYNASYNNVYATGAVHGAFNVGGLIGSLGSSPVSNAYATGYVYGTTQVGGLIGSQSDAVISNSYWDTQTSGLATSAGGSGLTTAQMMQQANFADWDFSNTWGITSAVSYPYLRAINPAGVQVVSGTVTGAAVGAPVSIANDGTLMALTATGGNGFYYAMLPAGSFTASNNLLAWLSGAPAVDGAVVAHGANTDVTQADITTGVLTLKMQGSVSNATLATAKGGLADAHIPYTVSGSDLAFGNSTVTQLLFLGGSANYNLTDSGGSIDTVAALSGPLSYTQPGSLAVGTVAGRAGITGSSSASVTLATTNPGANLTLDQPVSAGDAVVLSAGENFINNAGATAIAAGGRWLVYSSDPATDTFGALLSNNTPLWSKTYADYGPGSVVETGNRYLFGYTPSLTVTPDDTSKVYGNVPNLTATVTGLMNADSFGDVFTQESCTPILTSPGTAATAAVSDSPYPINAAPGSLAVSGYATNFNSGLLTVTPKPITVTADKQSKGYGSVDPLLTCQVTAGGLVESDSLAGALTRATGETVAAGPYTIGQGSLANGNYTITFNNGELTINPAPLSVTASDFGKTYDGLAYSGGNGVAYRGFADGETAAVLGGVLGYNGTAQGATEAGSYTLTPDGLTSGNYTISFNNGTLTVDRALLTVQADDQFKFAGDANPPFTFRASGFVGGQTMAELEGAPLLGTMATPLAPVGDYPITIAGLAARNYLINFVPGTLTVASHEIRTAAILAAPDEANKTRAILTDWRETPVNFATPGNMSREHSARSTRLQVQEPGIMLPAGASADQGSSRQLRRGNDVLSSGTGALR